jgi:phage host-nuclease inhibitor protein Gam
MEKLARATYAKAGLEAELNTDLAEVRAGYEMQLTAIAAECDTAEKLLKEWAKRNRPADGKTIELVHGTIEIRTSTPAVKLAPGQTDASVIERLRASPRWATAYIRTVEEINREQLIADRECLAEADLDGMGVRIGQVERIHVTPKMEGVAT